MSTAAEVEALASLIAGSSRVTAFTGAGISTESGIPDFRSPGGVWTRYDPRDFTFDRYVDSAEVRASSWAMRREFFAHAVEPNAGHRALARIEESGRGGAVVTQNIDGLHQAAGSTRGGDPRHRAHRDVHRSRAATGAPAGCGFTAPYTWAFEQVDAGVADPPCPGARAW